MNKWFVFLGRLEGTSFLIMLMFAMPLKYYAEFPLGVRVMGPLHGILFLMYCVAAFWNASNEQWPLKKHLLAYVAAVLPFGTFLFERKYSRERDAFRHLT